MSYLAAGVEGCVCRQDAQRTGGRVEYLCGGHLPYLNATEESKVDRTE